ncbi:MAG: response regulator [Leptospiraceae bacterium]|nr:response regulator [Leptospiraceae bacterium]
MKIRLPVFIQLSLLIIIFSVSSTVVSLSLFKNFTKEVIEDEIFSKYLRDSENITHNLEPILKQYEDKISFCLVNEANCDNSFIELIKLNDAIIQKKLIRISSTNYYLSEDSGISFLFLSQDNKEFLVSLLPLQNELLDISVIRDDYILGINKDGYVILNISSPFPNNTKLELDKDTLSKLQADITSGNFYLKNGSDFISMNLFHTLPYLNLKLVIGNENKFVFYELNKIEKFAWKIFFFIIPVILFLSFIVSQIQKKRFTKISSALKDLTNENFSVRIEEGKIKQLDEIDDLISAFNFMATELEKFHKMNIDKILDMNSKLLNANLELEEAKKNADSANKAKTHFLATMSHDIRTPLNAIIGFTQLIQQGEDYSQLPAVIQNQIQNIYLGGRNLSELINNILDLSKIEAGKMEINEEDVNIKILLQGIYSINNSLAENKNINFQYKIDSTLPDYFLIDRTKLNQVIMNLCSNAIKFTPANGSVYIEAVKVDEMIEFKLKDEGIGIPKEKQARIFEAFEQSDKTISTNFGGTGLGLSIVKKMTEILGGSISLESEINQGSCFSVKFPLKKSTKQSSNEKIVFKKFENPYKVLVVDDNQMNYEILRFHLKKIGLESFYANNGESGLDLAQKILPDIILLDIHMPGISGVEVRKKLSQMEKTASIPTIVMSADVFSEAKNSTLEISFSDFISKPIDFNELNSLLEKNLRKNTIS